jgi:hypothetical protein
MQIFVRNLLAITETDKFYERMFYEQWSSKLIFEDGLCQGLEADVSSLKQHQLESLWDDDSSYSLTNYEGIKLWFKAVNNKGGRVYLALRENLNIKNDDIIDTIRDWLETWRVQYFYEVAECNGLFRNIQSLVNISTSFFAYAGAALGVVSLIIVLFKKSQKHRV